MEMEQEATAMQEIDFPSQSENISLVEKMIDTVCDEYKIHEDYYGNILIAITEAVNNAIIHGNKQDPTKVIKVKVEPGSKELVFVVEDQGEGFDFTNLPDPTDPENIEKPNGRGIFLMKHLADDVEFENDGRRVKINFSISAN